MLTEELVTLDDRDDIRTLLIHSTAYAEAQDPEPVFAEFRICNVVYVAGDVPQLVSCRLSREMPEEPVVPFTVLLDKLAPRTLAECVYACTIHDPFGQTTPLARHNPLGHRVGSASAALSPFFADSRGYLLYSSQVEVLYRTLTGCSVDKATIFRKELWKREDWAWAEADLLRFPGGVSLRDVFDERLLYDVTFQPALHEGFALYNHLHLA